MVAFSVKKNLSFIFKPAESTTMQNTVSVTLEIRSERMFLLFETSSPGRKIVNRIGSKVTVFVRILIF
jgi:hypothetical protein